MARIQHFSPGVGGGLRTQPGSLGSQSGSGSSPYNDSTMASTFLTGAVPPVSRAMAPTPSAWVPPSGDPNLTSDIAGEPDRAPMPNSQFRPDVEQPSPDDLSGA